MHRRANASEASGTSSGATQSCFRRPDAPYSGMALILTRRVQPLRGLVDLAPMLNVTKSDLEAGLQILDAAFTAIAK